MNNAIRARPDPDALLAQVQAQAQRESRGKLRIYFGASAGTGKTYAMLNAAKKLQAEGREILVGVVETHGRADTAVLLDGLEILPLHTIEYRDTRIQEFDIDGALARKPSLILVDEFAHSNAPGSRHPKRWQDVAELLAAGIDVFTTLNVQHLESLNEVVGSITGIRVAETLPDTVFDEADEVVLVDLPVDELLARLKQGKVYASQQAERAARNFFRKGNLIALRELALRRTADRIQDDVQAYRIEKSISTVWQTDNALLVCVGPNQTDEQVVRNAARLANQLNASWQAIYIETPQLQRLPEKRREAILKTLKLAEELGATTAVIAENDIATSIVQFARTHNFSKLVLGQSRSNVFWRLSIRQKISRLAPEIDLFEFGRSALERVSSTEQTNDADRRARKPIFMRYMGAIAASLVTVLLASPLRDYFDPANIVMLFLLTVVLVAVKWGRGAAITSACVGVAAFDFFFVPPRFSFAVSDWQYIVTFTVMLAVGLITAHLTANLRFQARVAAQREARSRALFEFARALSPILQTDQVFELTRNFVANTFHAKACMLLPDHEGHVQLPKIQLENFCAVDLGVAQWAFDKAKAAGIGTDTLPGSPLFYLPLVAPMRTRGVLAIEPPNKRWILIPEQRQQLETFAALAAIALERVHYSEVAQDALIKIESERLRNSLLAALSHDLRTPLTTIVGLAESLTTLPNENVARSREFAQALRAEALRMRHLVINLLDMARIQSGEVKLNLQWNSLEEVVGSALRASGAILSQHNIKTELPFDLPLVHFDAMLIERVLCNLLENASKYTPPNTEIMIAAEVRPLFLEVSCSDNGPGLPAGQESDLFEKFTRGKRESAIPGVGLGLAICRAIVEAHGGTIRAQSNNDKGTTIIFTLPLGQPPEFLEAL